MKHCSAQMAAFDPLQVRACMLCCSFVKVGAMVFLCHDVNDIFMEGAKMARYAEHKWLPTALFAVFMLSWFTSRIYYFPAYVIRSVYHEPIEVQSYPSASFCLCDVHSALLFSSDTGEPDRRHPQQPLRLLVDSVSVCPSQLSLLGRVCWLAGRRQVASGSQLSG